MIIKANCLKIILFLPVLFLVTEGESLKGQQLPMEMVVTNRYANIRKGPGTGYNLVATLYHGDRLRAERKFRNWLRVLIPEGRIGWVREDLVGPYDPDDRPLTDEEADSLKNLIDSQIQIISELGDSSTAAFNLIRSREQARDSLMALLGLSEIPDLDSVAAEADTAEQVPEEAAAALPYDEQESVLSAVESFTGRSAFSPYLGVLIFDGEAAAAAGFSAAKNFTREFAYKVEVSFSRLNPPEPGMVEGGVGRTFITGGLTYSYKPGELAVPYLELGSGIAYTQAGDFSDTALDLVFGAGCRLYVTSDLSLDFGYRGHAVMSQGNDLLHLVHLGGGFHLPMLARPFEARAGGKFYLAPYVGYQMFSTRFSLNGTAVSGMRLGYNWTDNLSLEISGSYLPVELNEGFAERGMDAAEAAAQVLYFPWKHSSGIFLLAGGGTLLFPDEGRPPSGTDRYSFFHYGAGVNLALVPGFSVRSELAHQIYQDVARLVPPDYSVSAASALRLSVGLDFSF